MLRDDEVVGVVTRSDLLRALGEPTAEEAAPAGPDLQRAAPRDPRARARLRGRAGGGGGLRRRLPRRRRRARPAHGRAELRRRHRRRRRRDRLRPRARAGARRPRRPARQVRHGDRPLRRAAGSTSRPRAPSSTTTPARCPPSSRPRSAQDLYRRDFTINAMAVSLKGEDFGRLVDFFGGLRDLEARVIRVLHNLSFIDDPTRLFRAIRYENRYGFHMEAHTLRPRARVRRDGARRRALLGAAARRAPGAPLGGRDRQGRCGGWPSSGSTRRSIPHLAAGDEAVELVAELDALRRALRARDAAAWRLRLAALARRLPPDELYDWFERLRLRRRDGDRIADAVTVAPRLRELVAATDEPAGCAPWRSRTIPTASSWPWPGLTRPPRSGSSATSRSCGTSGWRSPAATSPSSA